MTLKIGDKEYPLTWRDGLGAAGAIAVPVGAGIALGWGAVFVVIGVYSIVASKMRVV